MTDFVLLKNILENGDIEFRRICNNTWIGEVPFVIIEFTALDNYYNVSFRATSNPAIEISLCQSFNSINPTEAKEKAVEISKVLSKHISNLLKDLNELEVKQC